MTIREWLMNLASGNQSTEEDARAMQNLLRQKAYPRAVVTCGVVYLEGMGQPIDIHSCAKLILDCQPVTRKEVWK
jgi:hypothetical protein